MPLPVHRNAMSVNHALRSLGRSEVVRGRFTASPAPQFAPSLWPPPKTISLFEPGHEAGVEDYSMSPFWLCLVAWPPTPTLLGASYPLPQSFPPNPPQKVASLSLEPTFTFKRSLNVKADYSFFCF